MKKTAETKRKRKPIKTAFNVLFYMILIVLVLFSIANIQVKRENDIANVFGFGFLSVQSDSMVGDNPDSFNQGDLIFVKLLDDASRRDLKVGDIVTFFDISIREFNTHRIVDFTEDYSYMITKGDKATINDFPMPVDYALATHVGTVPGLGKTIDYMQSPIGFALLVILPVFLIFIYEGFGLVRNFMALNREKYELEVKAKLDDQMRLTDVEKERIRQELLEEMKAKQG